MKFFSILPLIILSIACSRPPQPAMGYADVDDQISYQLRAQSQYFPEGKPVRKGWLSRSYGLSKDPFTGRKKFHYGFSYSGVLGTRIYSVATGTVVVSGRAGGCGKIVEVDHHNGYSTRYSHNRKNLVLLGQLIKKGELVAEMGGTGRSTGSYVHFMIFRNGKPVDPKPFVNANRKVIK